MTCWVLFGQDAAVGDCLEMNEDIFTSIIRRYVALAGYCLLSDGYIALASVSKETTIKQIKEANQSELKICCASFRSKSPMPFSGKNFFSVPVLSCKHFDMQTKKPCTAAS